MLKIVSFRQIPGYQSILCELPIKGQHCICQYQGIDHGQVVGTDNPGPFMPFEMKGAFPSELIKIPHPVTHQSKECKIERAKDEDGNPAKYVLHQYRSPKPHFYYPS